VNVAISAICITALVRNILDSPMYIAYFECVSVALVLHRAVHMRGIIICGLSACTIFFRFISNGTSFGGKNL
jgi:hypothetical protein